MGPPPAPAPRTSVRSRLRGAGARVGLVVLIVVLVRSCAYGVAKEDARALLDERAESTLVPRRDYLAARLGDVTAQTAPGGQFGGEWVTVTLSMTAMATANMTFSYPDTVPRAKEIIDRCLELALAKETRAFDTARWGEDALDTLSGDSPHIGYLGHLAVILEAKRVVGGGEDPHEKPVLAALRRRVSAAPSPILETYPGERYTADNMVVFAAIAMSEIDHAGRTERSALATPVVAKAKRWIEEHLLDGPGGAIVFLTDEHGMAKGHGRGSGVGWSSLFLPFIDAKLATSQATVLRDRFRKSLWPFGGAVCEYEGCAAGTGDVDSGPVIRGTSPSGTGFALAAAKTLGDEAWLDDMLSISEWVGITVSLGGKRRFLLAPLVGDAIVLAAMSTRSAPDRAYPWDGRYLSH